MEAGSIVAGHPDVLDPLPDEQLGPHAAEAPPHLAMPRWRMVKFTAEWNGSIAHWPGAIGRGAAVAVLEMSFVMPSTLGRSCPRRETGPSVVVRRAILSPAHIGTFQK